MGMFYRYSIAVTTLLLMSGEREPRDKSFSQEMPQDIPNKTESLGLIPDTISE